MWQSPTWAHLCASYRRHLANIIKPKVCCTAGHVGHPVQMRQQNSGVTWPNFAKFLWVVNGLSSVLMHASICDCPIIVECQCSEWRTGMPVFTDLHLKSVTIATSLEQSGEEGQLDDVHPYVYRCWKFGEDWSNTFWDNWSPRDIQKIEVWVIRYDTVD